MSCILAEAIKKGYISGWKNGKAGILDIEGKTVIEPNWESVTLRNDDYFTMTQPGDPILYTYNTKTKQQGKIVQKVGGISIGYFDEDYLLYENETEKSWGFMDYGGKILSKISSQYERPTDVTMSDGYIFTFKGQQIYYFDVHGNSITSKEWESASDFLEGYAKVKIKGKWGFINKKGETVIAPVWDDVNGFTTRTGPKIAEVWKDKQSGWINEKGEVLGLFPLKDN